MNIVKNNYMGGGGGGNSPLFARKFDDGLDIARYREILFGQGTKAAR